MIDFAQDYSEDYGILTCATATEDKTKAILWATTLWATTRLETMIGARSSAMVTD